MFRNAHVTFRTTRHGDETRTDTLRVWFSQELFTDGQEDEVRYAARDAAGVLLARDVEIISWSWA